MQDISTDRVRELVEARFETSVDGASETPAYTFKFGFKPAFLTEKEKRRLYSAVIGFAEQLKRQTGHDVLVWRVRPELNAEIDYETGPYQALYFRAGTQKTEKK